MDVIMKKSCRAAEKKPFLFDLQKPKIKTVIKIENVFNKITDKGTF